MVASKKVPPGPRFSATVAALFPHGTVAAELDHPVDARVLSEAEAKCCATFGAKRMADFAAGRACAHHVLEALGHADVSLLIDADRRPRWPAGIVGSISHTEGYCAVVATTTEYVRSLGFDAERIGRVAEELWPSLFTDVERDWLETQTPDIRAIAATLLFSAKEAFYKCRFHVDPEWLDFTDAEVTVPRFEATGRFAVRLVRDVARGTVFDGGRYALTNDVVLTGMSDLYVRRA